MTSSKDNRSEGKPTPGEGLGAELHRALSSLGWRLPETEDEIAEAEEWVEGHPPVVPHEIADPEQALARPRGRATPMRKVSLETEDAIEENLARAAREGGSIPPEIEERMRKDREDAERESDQS